MVFPVDYRTFRTTTPYLVMLLVFLVLLAYYPANFGIFSSLDDDQIVAYFESIHSLSLKKLFIPETSGGIYYRPFIALSFLLDKYLWNLSPGLMHLENVLFHLINSLLVYCLALRMLPPDARQRSLIPFLSALLFGVHPVNTESVNWISGRTDLLAGIFVLLSANLLLLYREKREYRYFAGCFLFMFAGFFTKEVTVAFLPAAFLLFRSGTDLEGENRRLSALTPPPAGNNLLSRKNGLVLASFLAAVIIYFLVRSAAFSSHDSRFSFTFRVLLLDIPHAGLEFLKAFTFYIKKILYPFPLNLAITDVDPFYEVCAVPVIFCCLYLISKRTIVSSILGTGFLLMLPALLVALNQIAWTPYAERYLYMPSAFIIISSVFMLSEMLVKFSTSRKWIAFTVLIILSTMGGITFHRTMLWTDNRDLLHDTVEKSPDFHLPRILYAQELLKRNDLAKAREQFAVAIEQSRAKIRKPISASFYNNKLGYFEIPELGLAATFEREGDFGPAADIYERILAKTEQHPEGIVSRLLNVYSEMLSREKETGASDALNKRISFYGKKLYNKKNPYIFYKLGKTYLSLGDRQQAVKYFEIAAKSFNDKEYRNFSEKILKNLKKQ